MKSEHFLINGEWRKASGKTRIELSNPATGAIIGSAILGDENDADAAVAAASSAFASWSQSSVENRIAVLERMRDAYESIADDMAEHLVREIGLTTGLARGQSMLTLDHFAYNLDILRGYRFSTHPDPMVELVREPVGVVVAITSWNAPVSQMLCKAVPAIAAGCTVIVKPSERAPLCGHLLAEAMAKADIPPGVFNLVNGEGKDCGRRLCEHADVDMVTFTGSVPGGAAVSRSAAGTIKRVHQELGGKSANVLLPDCDFDRLVPAAVAGCMMNAGQVCAAPTRLIVPQDRFDQVARLAVAAAQAIVVGMPEDPATTMGPLANEMQFNAVREKIAAAIAAGTPLLTGSADRPENLTGHFLPPTIFGPVDPDAPIAQEEVFGPALCILTYTDEEDAIRIANNSRFGLAAYVEGKDYDSARRVAGKLRAGYVRINSPGWTNAAPFGGFRQSGNGKQYGVWGFEEFLEIKAIVADQRED